MRGMFAVGKLQQLFLLNSELEKKVGKLVINDKKQLIWHDADMIKSVLIT